MELKLTEGKTATVQDVTLCAGKGHATVTFAIGGQEVVHVYQVADDLFIDEREDDDLLIERIIDALLDAGVDKAADIKAALVTPRAVP